MRLAAAAVVILSSCGGKAATPPPAQPTKPVVPPVVAIPAATCTDVAVILRGKTNLEKDAAEARETLIKEACEADKWTAEMLKCVSSTPDASACLDKLTEDQRVALNDRIYEWRDEYGIEEDPVFDESDFEDPPEDWSGGGDDGADEDYASCDDAVTDKLARDYPAPPKDKVAADGDFVVKLRKQKFLAICQVNEYGDDEWASDAKICLRDAAAEGASVACAKQLTAEQQAGLTKASTDVDAIAKKTFDLRKKPAAIGCPQVVTATYADAKWKDKLDKVTAKDRKAAIDQSRAAMTKACTAEKWDATTRACVVANDAATCFEDNPWSYPARGVIIPTGLAECDEYIQTLVKYATCKETLEGVRTSIFSSIEQFQKMVREAPAESKDAMKEACKQGHEAAKNLLTSTKC